MPIGPDPETFAQRCQTYQSACTHQNKPQGTRALYVTLCLHDDEEEAERLVNNYLEQYYGVPAQAMRRIQACCGGNIDTILRFLNSYVEAGAEHLIIRVVGDYKSLLPLLSQQRTHIANG